MQKHTGYFGIGILNIKTEQNIGTLWRSAGILGASFIFTIGRRYKKQAGDTNRSWHDIPLYHYETFAEFYKAIPFGCKLIGIELDPSSMPIAQFEHPERCIYLLGSEDGGLSRQCIDACHQLVQLPGNDCLNVAVAGSIVMFDRCNKRG